MKTSQFKEMLLRADTLRGVAGPPEDIEFWVSYMRGLRQLHHDDFGTDQEHDTWFSIPTDERDMIRRARGEGYRAGFAGLDPVELFKTLNEAMSTRDLAEATGKCSAHIRRIASKIPGSRKTDSGWKFPESAVEWVDALPKPGRKPKET